MSNYIEERHQEKLRKIAILYSLIEKGITDRGELAEAVNMTRKGVNAYLRTMGIYDMQKHWNKDTITCKEIYDAIVSPYKRPQRIERVVIEGKTYIDVTPFIVDCGTAYDVREKDD